ncbi:DUF1116 domain-containing protein [Elusimicrobiota bacterium]
MNLNDELKIVNIGTQIFTEVFKQKHIDFVNLDWAPPLTDAGLLTKLDDLQSSKKVKKANDEAFRRLNTSRPVLIGVKQAKEVIEGLDKFVIYHAGPPVTWENMCGPMKGAAIGACIYEGWAKDIEQATDLCRKKLIRFAPCHHHNAVGPMAGILSPSMYVWVVKNEAFGNTAFCSLNEGLGKVLRFGAFDKSVIDRLKWMETLLGPSLQKALEVSGGGLDITNLTAQALLMGDECHNRNVAATNLLLKELTKLFINTITDSTKIIQLIEFIDSNPHFYLNLSMAACKCISDTILNIENSTIVSAMARNGTHIGIRVAGCGNKWFTAKAGIPKGLFFPGYSQNDANPDIGDSTVSEVVGIGGFAMAAAPAIVKFVGGESDDALKYTMEMTSITHGLNHNYQIPQMNFMGTPTGIDILRVIDTRILPLINTGIAHKKQGIGQIGAGILRAPATCFIKALKEMEIKNGHTYKER